MHKAKIEIFSRPIKYTSILGEYAPHHLYIIYTNSKGDKFALRGGPERDGIGMLVDDLKITNEVFNDSHIDNPRQKPEEHISVEIASGSDEEMSGLFERMWKIGQEINAGNYDYKIPVPDIVAKFFGVGAMHCQNSNTAVYVMVTGAELDVKIPHHPSGQLASVPCLNSHFDETAMDKVIDVLSNNKDAEKMKIVDCFIIQFCNTKRRC